MSATLENPAGEKPDLKLHVGALFPSWATWQVYKKRKVKLESGGGVLGHITQSAMMQSNSWGGGAAIQSSGQRHV